MTMTISSISAYTGSLAKLQASFKTSDTDQSGALSKSEFEAAAKANTGLLNGTTADATFAKLDGNHDGQLSTAELTTGINLATQVQSVLLQGQELQSNAYQALLGTTSNSGSIYDTLFGNSSSSSTSNYSSLTSSLLGGGSASTTLASLLTGGDTNTSVSSGLFGGLSSSTNALIQELLSRYSSTDAVTTNALTQA